MKVKILKRCFIGTGDSLAAGSEHDVPDNIAAKLISRGFAEQKRSAGRPKKVVLEDRAFAADELEAPEGE